jgi:hypothetical protein
MSIVITGNPIEGFKFYGPFATHKEAIAWANSTDYCDGAHWWITDLTKP